MTSKKTSTRKSKRSTRSTSASTAAERTAPATTPDEDRWAAERASQDALFQARNIAAPDAPAEPPMIAVTPSVGPNPDGLTNLAVLSQQPPTA